MRFMLYANICFQVIFSINEIKLNFFQNLHLLPDIQHVLSIIFNYHYHHLIINYKFLLIFLIILYYKLSNFISLGIINLYSFLILITYHNYYFLNIPLYIFFNIFHLLYSIYLQSIQS